MLCCVLLEKSAVCTVADMLVLCLCVKGCDHCVVLCGYPFANRAKRCSRGGHRQCRGGWEFALKVAGMSARERHTGVCVAVKDNTLVAGMVGECKIAPATSPCQARNPTQQARARNSTRTGGRHTAFALHVM